MSPITVFGPFLLPIALRSPTPCSDLTAPTAPSSQSHTFCHSQQFQPLSRQFHALPSQKLAVSQWSATQTALPHTAADSMWCYGSFRCDTKRKKKKKKKKKEKRKKEKKIVLWLDFVVCMCCVCSLFCTLLFSSLLSLCLDLCV